ncbi:hypothetical protein JYU34_020874 [Plutella xylostella]|uniref:Uncharacterized protein n=1 Tax=Plutella xylostella TaxID=51655 RepID=A0ABQ7PSD5_PLUXY|nr:hypothetical protein JYU34_020874 [Plutella xylostella]
MGKCLDSIYNELIEIRKYLIKQGQKRFKGAIAENKLSEANEKLLDAHEIYKNILSSSSEDEICAITVIYNKIRSLCLEINDLCSKRESCSLSSNSTIMENFDLRTASSLIPVMDGSDDTTIKLVESVELYETMLKEDHKKLLISFILKTRLTKNGKLKLKSEYQTVKDLISDIHKYLITKKSSTSLLTQLNNITQNNLTLQQYASKIEEMFVDLTISQADNNPNSYEILRPINEKLAIKRFADGLRNRRLGTIITARNYESLREAIRAAEDEELAQPPAPPQHVMASTRGRSNYNTFYRGRTSNYRGYHGNGSREFFPRSRGNFSPNRGNYHADGNNFSNRGNRRNFHYHNNYNSNRVRGYPRHQNMYPVINEDEASSPSTSSTVPQNNEHQFFRA